LEREVRGQLAVERGDALPRCPQLAVCPVGIAQRRFHRVPAPQPNLPLTRTTGAAPPAHAPGSPPQVSSLVLVGHAAPVWRPPASAPIDRQAPLRHGRAHSAGRSLWDLSLRALPASGSPVDRWPSG